MTAAQIAVSVLVGVLIGAATVLFIFEEPWPAWIFGGFGLFGFFSLLAMIVTNNRPPRAG